MDRIVPPHTLESTRAWLRAQARAAETPATGQKLCPTERAAATPSGGRSQGGHAGAPFGSSLAVPADVADALAQWVRRAHIEVEYLPRDSDRRKTLVQAAYVAETFVRAAHDGEVLLPNPAMTCARIGYLMKLIEVNQGIRHVEARRRELDLVRPWLAAWRSSMGSTATITTTSILFGQCPDWPAAAEIRGSSRQRNRLWISLMAGAALAAALGCVPLPLSEQSRHSFGRGSMHADVPHAATVSDPVPHQEIQGGSSGAGAESPGGGGIVQDRPPAAAVRGRAPVRVRGSTARRALVRQRAPSKARQTQQQKTRRSPDRV